MPSLPSSLLAPARPFARRLLDRHPIISLRKHLEAATRWGGWSPEREEDAVILAVGAGMVTLSCCPSAFRMMRLGWMVLLLLGLVPFENKSDIAGILGQLTAFRKLWSLGVPVAHVAQFILQPSPRVEVYLLLLQLVSVDSRMRDHISDLCSSFASLCFPPSQSPPPPNAASRDSSDASVADRAGVRGSAVSPTAKLGDRSAGKGAVSRVARGVGSPAVAVKRPGGGEEDDDEEEEDDSFVLVSWGREGGAEGASGGQGKGDSGDGLIARQAGGEGTRESLLASRRGQL